MNIRKITSLTALLSFIALAATSVVLYLTPQGRVAYWADWRLWRLSKTEWGNLHINLGVLFLIAMGVHIYYNWKAILSYLKDKLRRIRVFNRDFSAALLITLAVIIGTQWFVPPFRWVIDLNDRIKADGAAKYGEPPYGHAELSTLKNFAARTGLDVPRSMERLQKAGIAVADPNRTILALSRAAGLSPKALFDIMKPPEETAATLPPDPPAGIGRKTLADLAMTYGLDAAKIIEGLAAESITATPDMSIRDIASQHQRSPRDVYDLIRSRHGTTGG